MLTIIIAIYLIGFIVNGILLYCYDAYDISLFRYYDSDNFLKNDIFRLVFMFGSIIVTCWWLIDKILYCCDGWEYDD